MTTNGFFISHKATKSTKKELRGLSVFVGKKLLLIFLSLLFSQITLAQTNDDTISLAGVWRFSMDSADKGVQQKFYEKILPETIHLPGSMVQNGRGYNVTIHTQWTGSIRDSSWYFDPAMAKYRQPDSLKFPFFLTPKKRYVDPAWYQKTITIPTNWKNKHIILFLERAHWETQLWVDNRRIGMRNSLSTPQVYDLTGILSPGEHILTIRVDNRIEAINPGPDSHSITDQTQGNWNGIVGKIQLRATPEVWIQQIQTFPDLKDKSVQVKLFIHHDASHREDGKIILFAKSFNTSVKQTILSITKDIIVPDKDTIVEINYPMGNHPLTWDEFHPALYHLTAEVSTPAGKDVKETDFGMREFGIRGTRFTMNGREIFLRGTVENCDFPNTGYPPMDVKSWLRVFKICKSYGLNEMRFHSYCPPKAAFEAADREGFYLHVEGPSWANHGSSLGDGKPIDKYIYEETDRIDQFYGNHPSFCMMAYGNEPRGGHQVAYLNKFVDYWKARDPRHLYTGASVGMSWPWVNEEQFIVCSGPRGLPWVEEQPNTMFDHRDALKGHDIPYVAHEMGQYCAFPDFSQIPEYTGVHEPRNFELFRDILATHHMSDEAKKFLHASGQLQALCYKGDIEAALRTPGMAGFELLGLNDYTGQGTALVGVLNVFWQSKPASRQGRGYVTPEEFRRFCSPVVPLVRIPKFVYHNNESFNVEIEIANFSEGIINNAHPVWQLKDKSGKMIASGKLPETDIPIGNCISLGKVTYPLNQFSKAKKLHFSVSIAGTSYKNGWNIWVYPDKNISSADSSQIYYCHQLDKKAEDILKKGGKVFLLCAGRVEMGKNISMHFLPVFWNTSWFNMRPPHTTGIYLDPKNPAFRYFPTEDFSDFQWWSIVNKQQVMWLKNFPDSFRPIVQPIDTWFKDRRLGLIFDAKVDNGKLMVCSADISSDLKNRPAARQLLYSLTRYMESKSFNPEYRVPLRTIKELFKK